MTTKWCHKNYVKAKIYKTQEKSECRLSINQSIDRETETATRTCQLHNKRKQLIGLEEVKNTDMKVIHCELCKWLKFESTNKCTGN